MFINKLLAASTVERSKAREKSKERSSTAERSKSISDSPCKKYSRLNDSSRRETEKAERTSKIICRGISAFYRDAIERERERREEREKRARSEERYADSRRKRERENRRREEYEDRWNSRKSDTIFSLKSKLESNRVMLSNERRKNEASKQQYSEEIDSLREQIVENCCILSKVRCENTSLKKENEKLKANLNNVVLMSEKSQKTINELKTELLEKDIKLNTLKSEIVNQSSSKVNLRTNSKQFTRDTKKYVFSMLEHLASYELIDKALKEASKCFFKQEIDHGISIRTIYRWTKEFKVCSLYTTAYLLKEFIKRKGKGILFQDETTLKNEKLQTFILCGNAEGEYYEILLGTVEIVDKSAESIVESFEMLIGTLAKVIKSYDDKLLKDTYNCIYGFMGDNARTGKKAYKKFEERANLGKKDWEIRNYITYSCVAHIGSNLSKAFGESLKKLKSGEETLEFVKQVSKELCLRSCAYHPPAIALDAFTKNRISIEKQAGKTSIKPETKITSIAGNRLQIYGVICQDILYSYEELLEFSKMHEAAYDICKKILAMLQNKETVNIIIFTSYIHEMFIYPIIRAAESCDLRNFIDRLKHIIEQLELFKYEKLPDIKKIEEDFGNKYKAFKYETLKTLSKLMERIYNDNSPASEKNKIIKVLKETVGSIKKRFIDVYDEIFKNDAYSDCLIKSQTNIVAERVFSQIKHTATKAPNKNITMRCAQVAAAHNKMTEVMERMTVKELDDLFNDIGILAKDLESDFRNWSENIVKGKVDICTKLVEQTERRQMKQYAKDLLDEQLKEKEPITLMEKINEILSVLSSNSQKEKFLNHQIQLWKKIDKGRIKYPKPDKDITRSQQMLKKIEYRISRINEPETLEETIEDLMENDEQNSTKSSDEDNNQESNKDLSTKLKIEKPPMSENEMKDLKSILNNYSRAYKQKSGS
uniref:DUF659 domain-containing protein n=1 Tax=Strongyloides papillosus TaxID=174720 RepID=A0A0N5C3I5_STREA